MRKSKNSLNRCQYIYFGKIKIKKMNMEKLKMKTLNGVQNNIDKIAALFPSCITEKRDETGNLVHAIDFDKLHQELSAEVVEGREERYQFTWPDKKKAILLANSPINATLRPCKEESVDFDHTQNLYIEGDNLDVLKCLKETYLGKVKMIYIDPPYNTGNDFVYEDDFAESTSEYLANSGQYDEQGNRLVTNSESNGRFHTDWLNMIYPRLKVARDLLSEDGVIFISIDDNEVDNLRKICDEIFGEDNKIENLIWKKRPTPPNDRSIGRIHEHILTYSKNLKYVCLGLLPRDEKSVGRYSNSDNDPRGAWVASDLSANGKGGRIVESCVYPIINSINGQEYFPPEGKCWLFNKKKTQEWIQEGRISFREKSGAPFLKRYLDEVRQGVTMPTLLTDFGTSQNSTSELDSLFDKKGIFEYSKPTSLIKALCQIGTFKDSIIFDFFSGSSTTAHAVMQLNSEDGGHRKFIMVQLPEQTDQKSEAYKAGYKNICEIGKERIRRAGMKIQEELVSKQKENDLFSGQDTETEFKLDIGFRVLKLDSSNMQDVYYAPSEYNQEELSLKIDNVKADRTPEDLLFQVMLELGATLDCKIEQSTIEGKTIFNVADGYLVACFDTEINDAVVTTIAKMEPQYAVFRDSSMSDDSTATNFEQIFKTYSQSTITKVF
jgi:adenine-specific DNA-methyltransferase